MADAPAYVGLGVRTPDIGGKLSQLMSLQSQKQALAGQAAEVASAEQSQRQRAGIARYMFQKAPQYMLEDGTLDLPKISTDPELLQVAGDQAPAILQALAGVKEAQVSAKQKLWELDETRRVGVAQMAGALLQDPDIAAQPDDPKIAEKGERAKQKLNLAMERYLEAHPDSIGQIAPYVDMLKRVPPGGYKQALTTVQLSALTPDSQVSAQRPQLVSKGDELINVSPTAVPTDPIRMGVSPEPSILTDAKGNQFRFNPQTNTVTPVGTGGTGGGRAPAPPAQPAPTVQRPTAAPNEFMQYDYPGQAKDIEIAQQEVQRVRASADRAPQRRGVYQEILKLSDDTSTGQLTAWLQKNPFIGQAFGDNYQTLAKNLEREAIENMSQMGTPQSNAGLDAAMAASGSTKFNPAALKAVTQFNYATNTALEQFRSGMDKAVGLSQTDYSKLPEFKSAWAKNFDINIFKLENAMADGDTKTAEKIMDGLSKEKAAELLEKRENLKKLMETGAL